MSNDDFVGQVRLALKELPRGSELRAEGTNKKQCCKITPTDTYTDFYEGMLWFGQLFKLAKRLKATIKLEASRSSGDLTFDSPQELSTWQKYDAHVNSVYDWYYVITRK